MTNRWNPRSRGALPWRALLVLAPLAWLSGGLLIALAGIARSLLTQPFQDHAAEWLVALVGVLTSATAVGLVLALIAGALGLDRLRALLDVRHAVLFGILASSLLWVAFTGMFWASYTGDEFAFYTWRVIGGVAYDLFVLVWLILGVRAAASLAPLRVAATLLSGAVGCFFTAFGLLIALRPLLEDQEPSLPLFGLVVWFLLAIFILPPALLTAGMSALFSGLRGQGNARGAPPSGHSEGSSPPEM